MEKYKPLKNQLGLSPLTNNVYWCNGRSESKDITQNFIHVLLMWIAESKNEELQVGQGYEKEITLNGQIEWTVQLIKGKKIDKTNLTFDEYMNKYYPGDAYLLLPDEVDKIKAVFEFFTGREV